MELLLKSTFCDNPQKALNECLVTNVRFSEGIALDR